MRGAMRRKNKPPPDIASPKLSSNACGAFGVLRVFGGGVRGDHHANVSRDEMIDCPPHSAGCIAIAHKFSRCSFEA